jgi:hypothetical protein
MDGKADGADADGPASWSPDLLSAALGGGRGPPGRVPSPPEAAAFGPSQPLAVLALLGDLLPPEWPPPGVVRAAKPHPPPSRMADRAALARACGPNADGLRRLVTAALIAEPALVRAALVRAVARAAGLGGGMGVFLARPIVDVLTAAAAAATAAPAAAAAGRAPSARPSSTAVTAAHAAARRALEVLVPLAYRPAVKAALLDLGAVDSLTRLLARLIPVAAGAVAAAPAATGPGGRLVHAPSPAPATSPAAAGAMVTMALEAVAALANPAIALDPSRGLDARGADDGPPRAEATVLAAVLLASLPRLGANAHVAARFLALLAGNAPGRAALAAAASRWWGQVEPSAAEERGGAGQPVAALTWAVARLRGRAAGDEGGDPDVAEAVAATLEGVAAGPDAAILGTEGKGGGGDGGNSDGGGAGVDPAPRRFAAAVSASLKAGSSSSPPDSLDPADLCGLGAVVAGSDGDDGSGSSTDGGGPGDDPGGAAAFGLPSACDAATRMFWRNITARAADAGAGPPPRIGGAAAVPHALPAAVPTAPPVAAWPAGLAPRKRPREVGIAELRPAPVLATAPLLLPGAVGGLD